MSKAATQYNDIVIWLEDCCKSLEEGKTYKTYRGLELSDEFRGDVATARTRGTKFFVDPMLPVDLLAVYSQMEPEEPEDKVGNKPIQLKQVNYYTLFWYISEDVLEVEKLEEKLHFYQFHLSRVADLRAVKIILVIHHILKNENQDSLKKMSAENGFGFWRFEEISKPPTILTDCQDYRRHMESTIESPLKDVEPLPQIIKKNAKKIGPYFDLFVREAVEALAGRTPMEAGKRYIHRNILDLVFELRNISYAEDLKKLVTKHMTEKGDDYSFVENAFSFLWKKNFPKLEYSRFLRVAELPLYNIFATRGRPYRDHYLHQFQVFILGACIIDKLIGIGNPDIIKNPKIDIQWLVTSSFHDMAYPLQLYDKWAKDFFRESIDIPDLGESDIKSYFVDKSLLSTLGFIINALCEKHFDGELQGNWLHKEKGLILFFYDRITKLKHHCLLSSLFLLKQAQTIQNTAVLNEVFVPSALAIVLHHYEQIFQKLTPKDEAMKNLPDNRIIKTLEFSTDPLSFLLMFCDCAQEWGRPKIDTIPGTDIAGDDQTFVLEACRIADSGCSVKIMTPQMDSIDDNFDKKNREISRLKKFLRRPTGFEFKMSLVDKSGEESPHYFKCIK